MHPSLRYIAVFILLTLFSFSLDAGQLPIKLGKPIRISPVPGPANPDPILQNLMAVMDNHYQPPFYPGGVPDYLSQIYFLSNYYTLNVLKFNPCDDRLMHINVGQNIIIDNTGTFLTSIGSSVIARSHNSGKTWNFGPPLEQIIPLGGNIAQIINSSFGPGTYNTYAKNGKLFGAGYGYFDMIANPPSTDPQSGFIRTSSDDNGKTWAPIKIDLASNVDFWWLPSLKGVGPREFYPTFDPANPNVIHASSMFPLNPLELYGNLFYTRSTDGGKTFPPLKQVYSMIDDPVWRAKFFDPSTTDPTYYAYGGFPLSSWLPLIVDDNTVILPVNRLLNIIFPFIGDQAAVRSLDNGKTWLKVAGATPQYIGANFIFDPGFANPLAGEIVKGQLVHPFFGDLSGQFSLPVVSPTTGRIYLTVQAFNEAISDPSKLAFISHLILSSSSDKGATFTDFVQINRTPTDILPGAQQAFAPGTAITSNGYYVVAYYDFRNWTGTPGENVETTPLQTDGWLDVYKETEDPRGGSTGVGLDFVGEIRLTKKSFDSRIIKLTTPVPYSTPFITGTPEGIPVLVNNNNELFVVYTIQTKEGVSPANITTGYKGMTIDTNGYIIGFLQRFKFANDSNQ